MARSAGLLGLRAPLNTAAGLPNLFDARAGVDEVFHPAHITLHLVAAERLGRLVVVKGGGTQAERSPIKAIMVHWHGRGVGTGEVRLPAMGTGLHDSSLDEVWRHASNSEGNASVSTIELALLALGIPFEYPDAKAAETWSKR